MLGSNLGDRLSELDMAKSLINVMVGEVYGCSSIYETEPWGFESKQRFLNQAIMVRTDLPPDELLLVTKHLEQQL